jgi:hypothetical protein
MYTNTVFSAAVRAVPVSPTAIFRLSSTTRWHASVSQGPSSGVCMLLHANCFTVGTLTKGYAKKLIIFVLKFKNYKDKQFKIKRVASCDSSLIVKYFFVHRVWLYISRYLFTMLHVTFVVYIWIMPFYLVLLTCGCVSCVCVCLYGLWPVAVLDLFIYCVLYIHCTVTVV